MLKKGRYPFLMLMVVLMALPPVSRAADQTINEDELFSGGATVEEQNKVNDEVDQELNKRRFGISGELTSDSVYSYYPSGGGWLGEPMEDDITNTVGADLFLDWRFKGGVKSFISCGAYLYPEGAATGAGSNDCEYHDLSLKECFVDANWKKRVYFRAGKQVLKWGRSYFWNPTDLINVEKKDYYDLDKNREGTNGLKVHIPFGVTRNIYLFAGAKGADRLADLSWSGKYEWLAGAAEMSLSICYKNGFEPVFGYDLSGRIGKLNWYGELKLANGKDTQRLGADNEGKFVLLPVSGWYSQVSLGCSRYFDYGDFKDRISLTSELFYNQAGYNENIFQKIDIRKNSADDLQKFSGYYQPFANGQYYLAVFGSVSKFGIPELTLNVNAISNLVDHSACLTAGISYQPAIKHWSVEFSVNRYLGDAASELKLAGKSYELDLGMKVQF